MTPYALQNYSIVERYPKSVNGEAMLQVSSACQRIFFYFLDDLHFSEHLALVALTSTSYRPLERKKFGWPLVSRVPEVLFGEI